jgi:hypothetical protein
MWKTVQQSPQDQTLDLRPSSLQQIGHSYRLCEISSWIRVARSSAVDFVVTFGGGGALGFPFPLFDCPDGCPDEADDTPGTKSGTSALSELSCKCPAPSSEAGPGCVN